ncbi:putative NrdI-like protein [compost metagenome]
MGGRLGIDSEVVKLIVVYDSLTGNVQRFVSKLDLPSVKITSGLSVDEPFILVTYTIGFGEIPKTINEFLNSGYHAHYLKGVAGSGNMVWGDKYCGAAVAISKIFNVPLIHKFELSGTQKDIEKFQQEVNKIV